MIKVVNMVEQIEQKGHTIYSGTPTNFKPDTINGLAWLSLFYSLLNMFGLEKGSVKNCFSLSKEYDQRIPIVMFLLIT